MNGNSQRKSLKNVSSLTLLWTLVPGCWIFNLIPHVFHSRLTEHKTGIRLEFFFHESHEKKRALSHDTSKLKYVFRLENMSRVVRSKPTNCLGQQVQTSLPRETTWTFERHVIRSCTNRRQANDIFRSFSGVFLETASFVYPRAPCSMLLSFASGTVKPRENKSHCFPLGQSLSAYYLTSFKFFYFLKLDERTKTVASDTQCDYRRPAPILILHKTSLNERWSPGVDPQALIPARPVWQFINSKPTSTRDSKI